MKSLLLVILPFTVVTYASFIFSQQACYSLKRPVAAKELPFSHKSHDRLGISCEACHKVESDGKFKGIPTVGECLVCHDPNAEYSTDPNVPKRKEFLAQYDKNRSYRPWGSHAKQPDLVFFSHAVHVYSKLPDGKDHMRCSTCHGNKDETIDTKRVKGMMEMGECMDCHDATNKTNGCLVCHD